MSTPKEEPVSLTYDELLLLRHAVTMAREANTCPHPRIIQNPRQTADHAARKINDGILRMVG